MTGKQQDRTGHKRGPGARPSGVQGCLHTHRDRNTPPQRSSEGSGDATHVNSPPGSKKGWKAWGNPRVAPGEDFHMKTRTPPAHPSWESHTGGTRASPLTPAPGPDGSVYPCRPSSLCPPAPRTRDKIRIDGADKPHLTCMLAAMKPNPATP